MFFLFIVLCVFFIVLFLYIIIIIIICSLSKKIFNVQRKKIIVYTLFVISPLPCIDKKQVSKQCTFPYFDSKVFSFMFLYNKHIFTE